MRRASSTLKRKFFPVERWVAKDFLFEGRKVEGCYIGGVGRHVDCPMNTVSIRFMFDNRSRDDVRPEKLFLRACANGAPIWIIMWDKDERINGPSKEVGFYNWTNYVLPRGKKGDVLVYVNLPPYIDVQKDVWVDIRGYLMLNSSFGSFKKEVPLSERVKPNMWWKYGRWEG